MIKRLIAYGVLMAGLTVLAFQSSAQTPNKPTCPPGEHLYCSLAGDGGPWICYCAAQ